MKINIIQTITNILEEDRTLIKSIESESYTLIPESGKALKNIKTGKIFNGPINIGTGGKVKDYTEIEIEE